MRFAFLSVCLSLAACGDDDAGESKDVVATSETTTSTDTAVADAPADTGMPETTTTTATDTAPVDTEPVDTEPADTEPADTEPLDTGTPETTPDDIAEGPEHLEVFFASVATFDTELHAYQFDGGFATGIEGTGEWGTLKVLFSGTTTGTYTCGPSLTNVVWINNSGVGQNTDAALGGSCTITVTKYQAGGRIQGTFSGVMAAAPPDLGIPFNEGEFDVFIQ